jgi:hypothetical protein
VESSELINRHNFKVGDQMKRHQVALIIALALLAAMASTSLVNGGLSAAALQDNPLESVSAMTPNDAMQSALQAASLIVRARVEQVASRWANDRSHLQSENTLTIRYVLRGAVEGPLVVHTTGGYLAEEKSDDGGIRVADPDRRRRGDSPVGAGSQRVHNCRAARWQV